MSTGTTRLTLTELAREAAKEGRWDTVADCYRERELLLANGAVPAEEAAHLRYIDRQVEERARLAQAALASLMRDTAKIRQRLQGLRQGQAAPSTGSAVLRLEA
jgi:enoyl-CoA hydratase/carnithine racemase